MDMRGKICVVTGANSGIGLAMSRAFARAGADVVMVARRRDAGEAALAEVKQVAEASASLELADLSTMSAVRELAARISARTERVDVLMNNAGLYLNTRRTTEDGFEFSFAVNHLAPFLLTNLLKEQLLRSSGARVITTASVAHRMARLDLDDLMMEKRWNGFRQYGNGKLANILFARELARRHRADGIRASSFHPGAVNTGFAQDEPTVMGSLMAAFGSLVLRSPEEGASTGIYLACAREADAQNGEYYSDRKIAKPAGHAKHAELAEKLWHKSAALTGLAR
jgi:NAD(P)-dependent dehydrogenase (short-subunit alcohol dehydrogenase family)